MNSDAAPIEMIVTPDRPFARAVLRAQRRQGVRTALMGLGVAALLIITSLGATVAEAPWWTAFGMVGLAVGVLLVVVAAAGPFQHRAKDTAELLKPVRYVLAPDGVEWTLEGTTVRLRWSSIRGVRMLPYGYLVSRSDGGPGHVICRTTLTVLQQAQLRTYFSMHGQPHGQEKSTTTGA